MDARLGKVFPPLSSSPLNEEGEREVLRSLGEHRDFLRRFCENTPQTNEVARSGMLFFGLNWACSRAPAKVNLLELGEKTEEHINSSDFI